MGRITGTGFTLYFFYFFFSFLYLYKEYLNMKNLQVVINACESELEDEADDFKKCAKYKKI